MRHHHDIVHSLAPAESVAWEVFHLLHAVRRDDYSPRSIRASDFECPSILGVLLISLSNKISELILLKVALSVVVTIELDDWDV
jgi:hypothetical protein